MRTNACGLDRAARLIVGAALAAVALGTSGGLMDRDDDIAPWQILAMFAAGELLVTGLLQWCPGNYLLGIDTCASQHSTTERIADEASERALESSEKTTLRVRAGAAETAEQVGEFAEAVGEGVEAVGESVEPDLTDRLKARLPVD